MTAAAVRNSNLLAAAVVAVLQRAMRFELPDGRRLWFGCKPVPAIYPVATIQFVPNRAGQRPDSLHGLARRLQREVTVALCNASRKRSETSRVHFRRIGHSIA